VSNVDRESNIRIRHELPLHRPKYRNEINKTAVRFVTAPWRMVDIYYRVLCTGRIRLFGRAWSNGLPRLSEFEFSYTGFDGLGLGGLGLVLGYTTCSYCS
jgi:hypothetical protein